MVECNYRFQDEIRRVFMYTRKKQLRMRYLVCLAFLLSCDDIRPNIDAQPDESVLISEQEFNALHYEQDNDQIYRSLATEEELLEIKSVHPKKPVTLIVYMAADNDLHPFAWKNIKQMEAIGSNENINVIVQVNTPGYFNPTKRYVIKKGRRLLVPAEGATQLQKLNSGSPYTLIDCVTWAMKHYPAETVILNLWDHGSGIYDPGTSKIVNAFDLFKMNNITHELELDRTIGYTDNSDPLDNANNFDILDATENYDGSKNGRGICFDETFKSYMNNQDLKFALSEIQNKVLHGKKIDVIWFDACLMTMLEIANICKDHARYLVGSEEVEFASGSNYELVLKPFIEKSMTAHEFACHVVDSYETAYQFITKDYTQSAIDLSKISALELNVNLVAQQLLFALQNQKNNSTAKLLQQCKSRPLCTCFEETTYIDLRNFYLNLQTNLNSISLQDPSKEPMFRMTLAKLIDHGVNLINTAVIANKVGANLQRACGISIYFPERGMFQSYPKCNFAQTNNWGNLLTQYLVAKKSK